VKSKAAFQNPEFPMQVGAQISPIA